MTTATHGRPLPAGAATRDRLPLTTFAIAFGLAGLAGVWTTAADRLDAPPRIAVTLWVVTAVVWSGLLLTHVVRGTHSTQTLAGQLRHPAQGPVAALVPVVGMLLGVQTYHWLPAAGLILVVTFAGLSAAFAAWILARWFGGNLHLDQVHGGYLLPTVAAGLIAGGSLARVGLPGAGYAAFAVGLFFWLAVGALILTRLAVHPELPQPLVPTLAILVAPPAVGGSAWFALAGPHSGPMALALAGLTVLLALTQVALLPRYRRLPVSLALWSFTFPYAATARYAVEWLALENPAGWRVLSWAVVLSISVFILTIAVRTATNRSA